MSRTFESPSSYDPSYSLLGRAVRAWVPDRLRGEAIYIVVLTGLTLLLLMSHYLGWALLKPALATHPSWQTLFWGGQVASVLLLAGVGLIGFRPSVQVTCSAETISLRQGDRSCTLPYAAIDEVARISARRYHRHYRRYAATRVFVGALSEEMLLLRTGDGPVIVALAEPETQTALRDHLDTACASSPEPVVEAQP